MVNELLLLSHERRHRKLLPCFWILMQKVEGAELWQRESQVLSLFKIGKVHLNCGIIRKIYAPPDDCSILSAVLSIVVLPLAQAAMSQSVSRSERQVLWLLISAFSRIEDSGLFNYWPTACALCYVIWQKRARGLRIGMWRAEEVLELSTGTLA